MKKLIGYGLACLLCLLAVTACSEDEPIPSATVERTVLVYIAGDNSLSRFALADLEEMREGMQNTNGELRLMVYIDTGSAQLIELKKENGNVVENIVREYGDRNSAGVEETREVFEDVFSNPDFSANSYGLIYWSHADGWAPYGARITTRWVGQDTGDGDNRMNISELVSVLDNAPHFSFIMFDACFMSSIEVAYELRNHTDYYIGSPTENPGPGAPYELITPLMAGSNAAVEMATAYFNSYNEMYNGGIGISNSDWTGGTSICVIQTSALEQLASVTAQVLPETTADNEALRSSVFDYDQRRESSSSYIGYYDFKELMQQLVTDETSMDAWEQAFEESIAYWSTTAMNYSQVVGMFSMEDANGITHYIPGSNTTNDEAYKSTSWYQDAGLTKLGW